MAAPRSNGPSTSSSPASPPPLPPLYRPHASISPICPTTNDKTATVAETNKLPFKPDTGTRFTVRFSNVLEFTVYALIR